jgi:glycosyltransferase involved in cell wall biosynthesis
MKNIIYISYDGMLEPLGESQVIEYLLQLSKRYHFILVSYEKKKDWNDLSRRQTMQKKLESHGIEWFPLVYHRSPRFIAKAWDIAYGFVCTYRLAKQHQVAIVHCRSYISAVLGLLLKKCLGIHFIFDMRGFWADERVDAGSWKRNSYLYRLIKFLEKKCILQSSYIISLTQTGVAEIKKFPYMKDKEFRSQVITTCTNIDRFSAAEKTGSDNIVLGYVGSTEGWYVFDPVLVVFKKLLEGRPEAKLKIVSRDDKDRLLEKCKAFAIPTKAVEISSCHHKDMPAVMKEITVGIFFIKPVFSKKASAPTKLGEFLACGIPCFTNAGVGDMDQIIQDHRIGVVVQSMNDKAELEAALERMLVLLQDSDLRARARRIAEQLFSLEKGVQSYEQVYKELLKSPAEKYPET